MRVVDSHEKAACAADDWFDRYANMGKWGQWANSEEIYKKLRALGENPEPQKVNEIIGNTSWTTESCDVCGRRATRWLAIKTDSGVTNVCERCFEVAYQQMFPNGR